MKRPPFVEVPEVFLPLQLAFWGNTVELCVEVR